MAALMMFAYDNNVEYIKIWRFYNLNFKNQRPSLELQWLLVKIMELEATITYLIFNKEGQNIENKMYHKLNYWLKIS